MPRSEAQPADHPPLTPVVLHILLALADGARHGYAIAQEVEEMSEGQVRMGPGTLYGSLQRMLDAGLVDNATSGRKDDPDEARRRYYRSTPLGRRVLEQELQRLGRVLTLARRKHLIRAPGAV